MESVPWNSSFVHHSVALSPATSVLSFCGSSGCCRDSTVHHQEKEWLLETLGPLWQSWLSSLHRLKLMCVASAGHTGWLELFSIHSWVQSASGMISQKTMGCQQQHAMSAPVPCTSSAQEIGKLSGKWLCPLSLSLVDKSGDRRLSSRAPSRCFDLSLETPCITVTKFKVGCVTFGEV